MRGYGIPQRRPASGAPQKTADALFSVAQCELVEGFLPPELARQLLLQLQADEPGWGKMQWWIGNNSAVQPGLSSKTSAHYQLAFDSGAGADSGDGEQGSSDGAWLQAPQVLRGAADKVTAAVNRRITSGGAARLPLEAADRDGWLPSYAVANCYASGDAGVGQHSDRLTRLGPLPIIASLSLGATRTVRLHHTQHLDLMGDARSSGRPDRTGSRAGGSRAAEGAGAGPSTTMAQAPAAAAGAAVVQVDIPMPHNALLIMWPPTQEAWKHEVGWKHEGLPVLHSVQVARIPCDSGAPIPRAPPPPASQPACCCLL